MIRKTIFFIFLFVIILLIVMQLNKNNPSVIIKSLKLKNNSLIDTDSMRFCLNYLDIFHLGEAELRNMEDSIYNRRQVYHLQAEARVSKFTSIFFKASARIDSYIDKEKMYPLRFTQSLIIPEKPKDEREVIYDQERNIMELKGVKRQILPNTQDVLSTFFFIRRQAFEVGKEFDININTNQKNYRFLAKLIEKKDYDIAGEKIGVWVLKAEIGRRDKNPRHRSSITIWFLDNPAKTPILIKTMTNIGPTTARLISLGNKKDG